MVVAPPAPKPSPGRLSCLSTGGSFDESAHSIVSLPLPAKVVKRIAMEAAVAAQLALWK